MENTITEQKLKRYFDVTKKAFKMAQESGSRLNSKEFLSARNDSLDMISRYISDAEHFQSKGSIVDAFAALNYAHGWLDSGARIGLFDVHDNKLFTVD
jgi:hypothetical protein